MPKTIQTIVSALVALVESWANPTNLAADLADAILLLNGVKTVDPNVPLMSAALKVVDQAQAGLANLQAGQAATVATTSVNGASYSLVVVKAGGPAAASLGL